jgi:hypothetical protein
MVVRRAVNTVVVGSSPTLSAKYYSFKWLKLSRKVYNYRHD